MNINVHWCFSVQLVNFWPTDDLNRYINLKHRVEARMALVDLSATFEDNVLKNEEIEDIISDDLRYRDKQLLRLKDEVLDIEDLGDSVSLTEFTLDDFRLELLKYIEANKEALEDAPFGLYTCVPTHPDYKVIGPGVIFCFRQEGQLDGAVDASGSLLEHIDESMADASALLLRLIDARKITEEFAACIDHAQVDVEVAAEGLVDQFALTTPEQSVVDEDAGDLSADRLREQRRDHAAVNAAGEPADHARRTHHRADALALGVHEVSHGPRASATALAVQEVAQEIAPLRRVRDLGMELHAPEALAGMAHGGVGARRGACQHLKR
jgi:hypothetical protein